MRPSMSCPTMRRRVFQQANRVTITNKSQARCDHSQQQASERPKKGTGNGVIKIYDIELGLTFKKLCRDVLGDTLIGNSLNGSYYQTKKHRQDPIAVALEHRRLTKFNDNCLAQHK